jgi:thiosulfate reductase cytochrome b subunit
MTTAEFHDMEAPSSASATVTIVKDHPLAIRWLHWINVPFLTVMTWSGLMLAWANESHEFGIFGRTVTVFPEGFYQALGVRKRLAEGLSWHLTLAWLFTLNGILYVVYLTIARQWGHLLPRRGAVRDAVRVILHDLHLRKEAPASDGYNAAQRIAYTLVVALGAVAVLTGLAVAKSARFSLLTTIFGGYHVAKLIHFSAAMAFFAFVVIHVLQVAKAGWQNFRSMIVGHKVVKGSGS